MTLGRHRRRRHRQGPRLLRGRDDARAVPGRRARARRASRCSGCTPPARSAARPRIVAAHLVQAGIHERVLTVAFEKQSESEAMWALSLPIPFQPPLHAGAGGYFAPHIRAYMRRSKAPDHIGILVALKDRQNALKNPYAHLHEHDITFESIKESMMLWDPIRYAETCPSSDGAVRDGARPARRRRRRRGRRPAGVGARHRDAQRADDVRRPRPGAARWAAQDCAADVYRAGRHHRPAQRDRRASRCTCRSRWFEPMWLENLGFADRRRGLEAGRGRRHRRWTATCRSTVGRRAVVQPDRRLGHAPLRRGGACRCGARPASTRSTAPAPPLGHAYGGGSQFFAMWVVGADKP